MSNIFTGASARLFSKENRIEEWIHRFLHDEGNNIAFSGGLKLEKRFYLGPLRMQLDLFERSCGPEENLKFVIDEEGFEWRVSEISKRFKNGWDMPPLIINFADNRFELSDGNHRYEAIKRLGIKECDVIIWISSRDDYQEFIARYSEYLEND